MKKLDWIALEETTGVFDGFYTFKNDAVDTARYLTERFVGSRWVVVNRSWNKNKRLPFWRDSLNHLTERFIDEESFEFLSLAD